MSDTSSTISRNLGEQTELWQATMHGVFRPNDAIPDFPRPPVHSFVKEQVLVAPNAALHARLVDLSAREGVSVFVTALATMGLQAARYAGLGEAVIGLLSSESVRANQAGHPRTFANAVALRVDLAGNPTVRDLLHRVNWVMEEDAAHRAYRFERLLEQFSPVSGRQIAPIFNTVLISSDLTKGVSAAPGTGSHIEAIADDVAECDLSLQITANDTGLSLHYEYDIELFARSTVERMANRLQMLLEDMVADPEQRIDRRFVSGSMGQPKGADDAARVWRDQRERLRAAMDQLTPREKQVFALVVTGKLNKQIAARLGITERTVKAHRAQVMGKLQVTSVAELVRIATQLDPIRPQAF